MRRALIGGASWAVALWLGPGGAAGQEVGIRIDGRLTEQAWEEAVVISDFVQGEPVEGAAADFARDRGDLLDLHPDNVFILKMNYWLGL